MNDDPKTINELAIEARCNKEAFAEIYDMYYDRLLGYAFRRVLDAQDAQDIISNTFYKALKKIDSYKPKKGNF